MALNYPHIYSNNIHRDIAIKNFDHLVKPGNKKVTDFVTDVAAEAINDYQNAQLGIMHSLKKYASSLVAYGATIGVPVAGVVGTTYYLFKDFIQDPSLIPSALSQSLYTVSPEGGYSLTGAGQATGILGGAIVTDLILNKAVGVAPLRSVAKWTAGMLSSAVIYAAYKAGEIASGSYEAKEKESRRIIQDSHERIFQQVLATYSGNEHAHGIADELDRLLWDVKNNPRALRDLQNSVSRLDLTLIANMLLKAKLTPSEIRLVLDRLKTMVKAIKETPITLREGYRDDNDTYNTELLSTMTNEEYATLPLPDSVSKHIEQMKANTFGLFHKVKEMGKIGMNSVGIASGAGAIAAVIGTGASYFTYPQVSGACQFGSELSRCWNVFNEENLAQKMGAFALASGIVAGTAAIFRGVTKYNRTAEAAQAAAVRHAAGARVEAQKIFDGVASELRMMMKESNGDVKKNEIIIKAASNVRAKISLVEAQLAKTGIFKDTTEVFAKLNAAVNDILKIEQNAAAAA